MSTKKIIPTGGKLTYPPLTEEQKAQAAALRAPGYTGKFGTLTRTTEPWEDDVGPLPPKEKTK